MRISGSPLRLPGANKAGIGSGAYKLPTPKKTIANTHNAPILNIADKIEILFLWEDNSAYHNGVCQL
jgi:hypothetical protein